MAQLIYIYIERETDFFLWRKSCCDLKLRKHDKKFCFKVCGCGLEQTNVIESAFGTLFVCVPDCLMC
jgi:hypothetical protein